MLKPINIFPEISLRQGLVPIDGKTVSLALIYWLDQIFGSLDMECAKLIIEM